MGQALLLKYPKQGWKILISWSEHRPYLSSIIHPIKKKKNFNHSRGDCESHPERA